MSKKTRAKSRVRQHRDRLASQRGAFTRLKNRTSVPFTQDYIAAGYPMVENESGTWKELHDLCKATFVDAQGRQTYAWAGSSFFFLTEEDANIFRALWYIA